MSAFSAINLDKLPAPEFIDLPSFEEIFEARKARLLEIAFDKGGAALADGLRPTLELESEPIVLLLQEDSYREFLLRAAVQNAAKSRLLAYATGPVLDHLAAEVGVERQVVQPADPAATPPIEEVLETDPRLRQRVQLAPESFTTGGTEGDYKFLTLTASPLVLDVNVDNDPATGQVEITVLSSEGDGVPSEVLLADVLAYLTHDDRRRLNDTVIVSAAAKLEFSVDANLTFYEGPDAALVLSAAQAAIEKYAGDHQRLGHDITVSGIYAALHQEGVQNVSLTSPAADIAVASNEFAVCTSINIVAGGTDV